MKKINVKILKHKTEKKNKTVSRAVDKNKKNCKRNNFSMREKLFE